MRVLIVDDEPPARRRLRRLLDRCPDVDVVGEAADGASAIVAVGAHEPEVVFLDVQMPDCDGFGVLEALTPPLPVVIFVTAHDTHGLRAFEVHAIDYLLKPFEDERLFEAVDRARELLQGRRLQRHRDALGQLVADRSPAPRRLAVRRGETTHLIEWQGIDWIETAGGGVRLHLRDGRAIVHRCSLRRLVEELPGDFVQVHRSHVVNARRVIRLHALFHGDCVVELEGGSQVRASRTYSEELRRALGLAADADR